MQKNVVYDYDVALWRYWPSSDFPIVASVRASAVPSALVAALRVMAKRRIRHVSYVAVRCPDGTFQRWENGLTLHEEVVAS
ncbi:hypothetical protein KDK_10820 [Dictyobacter kobayashii]|uniref:Uncharacterized protein n=2 Tax=Dictyobacter kobayashii TaxID=2014872 RepID=A0A402AE07_9CHLR|nr:hypothetical protein KDK_10820 [Dictyobacter kobayashii]